MVDKLSLKKMFIQQYKHKNMNWFVKTYWTSLQIFHDLKVKISLYFFSNGDRS